MLLLLFQLLYMGCMCLLIIKTTDTMTKHILCSQRGDGGKVCDSTSEGDETVEPPFKKVCKSWFMNSNEQYRDMFSSGIISYAFYFTWLKYTKEGARGCWCNVSVLNIGNVMDSLYNEFDRVLDKFPTYHKWILLGDFSTKVGGENIF
jgi:hypothetical protein